MEYMGAMFSTLTARTNELVAVGRRAVRWRRERTDQSFTAKICNRLHDKTSLRTMKVKELTKIDSGVAALLDNGDVPRKSDARRAQLVQRLRDIRAIRRARTTVVFFGDGTFAAGYRGHAPVAKKKWVKFMAHCGLTILLDEYRTSKMCPCGKGHELKTTGDRLRVHKNGDGCPFLESLGVACDRDLLATLDMLRCALAALRGEGRPQDISRS